MTRQEVMEKTKKVISDCFPDMDVTALQEDSVINTETAIDSMGFVLVICKLEALFNVKIPERQWAKLQTLGDVERMRKTCSERAYQLALHQISGTDLDIIASTLGLQNVCLVYAAEKGGEKGIEFFLNCLNGPSRYNAATAEKLFEQLSKIHDM